MSTDNNMAANTTRRRFRNDAADFSKATEFETSQSNGSTYDNKSPTLSWHDINVRVKPKRNTFFNKSTKTVDGRHILRNVSGKIEPGQLLAIMGASGSGKTSLINVLANRNLHTLDVTGEVRLNDCIITDDDIKQHTAYVQQNDLFCGSFTVREHVIFQVMLRRGPKFSYAEKMKEVEHTIEEFGLFECANTRIGVPGYKQGISGGERKRLAFATEMLSNSAIMFCDEPTSGLDAFMSKSVVSVLKKLAEEGRTIVFTVHQPSSEVYEMFDIILLMADGRVAYMGDRKGITTHFENLGLNIPLRCNEAEFIIFNLAIIPGKVEECKKQVKRICDTYDKWKIANEDVAIEYKNKKVCDLPYTPRGKALWSTQIRMLTWRFLIETRREYNLTATRICAPLMISFLVGLIFFDQKLTQAGITNINGALFILLTQMSAKAYVLAVHELCNHMPLFLREYGNGIYRTDTYFLSKTIADLPVLLTVALTCTTSVYWMAGLKFEIQAFLICLMTIMLVANTAASYGYLISCASSSVSLALSIGQSTLMMLRVLGGYHIRNKSLPWWSSWIKYFSWFAYGNELLIINQWNNIENITCEESSVTCIHEGETVIKTFDFNENAFYPNIINLVVLLVLYRTVAFLLLFFRAHRKS